MQEVYDAAPEERKPDKIRFHDLRHWGCTRLADYHVDALDLAKTTGHRTLQVLARYYNPSRSDRNKRILARAAALKSAS
jgi:integrase